MENAIPCILSHVVDYVVNPVRLSHATASVRRARMHFNMQESLTA